MKTRIEATLPRPDLTKPTDILELAEPETDLPSVLVVTFSTLAFGGLAVFSLLRLVGLGG